MTLIVKVLKLDAEAIIPSYSHAGDAGVDLFSVETISVSSGEKVAIHTGISLEIPNGYVGLVWDKSGLAITSGLKVLGGVVDSGYRGEIIVGLINLSRSTHHFKKGERIAQMLFQKIETVTVKEVDMLTKTERSSKGFGSTGK